MARKGESMMAESSQWLTALIAGGAAVLAGLAGQLAAPWANRWSREHEEELRWRRERAESRRKTLMDLLESLIEIHHAAVQTRDINKWGNGPTPKSEVDFADRTAKLAEANFRAEVLAARIRDETLRSFIDEATAAAHKLGHFTDDDDTPQVIALAEAANRTNDHIGSLLDDLP